MANILLSAFSDEYAKDFEEQLSAMTRFGISHIELRFIDGENVSLLSDEKRIAVRNALDRHGITANKNCVPNDQRPPKETSGLRVGTAAMTTKGYTAEDFIKAAHRIDEIIKGMDL